MEQIKVLIINPVTQQILETTVPNTDSKTMKLSLILDNGDHLMVDRLTIPETNPVHAFIIKGTFKLHFSVACIVGNNGTSAKTTAEGLKHLMMFLGDIA